MKSCGKSTAEPEKEPNAPIINTFSLITRLLHQISAALCLVLKIFFYQCPVGERTLAILLGLSVLHPTQQPLFHT